MKKTTTTVRCDECNFGTGQYCSVCGRDEEGYTVEERMVERKRSEIHGSVFRPCRRRGKFRTPFDDAVIPGSVRVRILGD